jgi:2-polyprenyl-6-hydroxyphenyl methylase/3-demethylubiquinone-9 3-methyltransferase
MLGSMRIIINHKAKRGMSFMTDVRDWLGGWPYEPATAEEICDFCECRLGLRKIKIRTGEANIEYLFAKPGNEGQGRQATAADHNENRTDRH